VTSDQLTQIVLALIAGLPTTLAVILAARWQGHKVALVGKKTDEVHSLVNSQRDALLLEIDRLRAVVEGRDRADAEGAT
jgi:hypothetical protein